MQNNDMAQQEGKVHAQVREEVASPRSIGVNVRSGIFCVVVSLGAKDDRHLLHAKMYLNVVINW